MNNRPVRCRSPLAAPLVGLDALLKALNAGVETIDGNPHHQAMHAASQEALRLAAEINGTYHS